MVLIIYILIAFVVLTFGNIIIVRRNIKDDDATAFVFLTAVFWPIAIVFCLGTFLYVCAIIITEWIEDYLMNK